MVKKDIVFSADYGLTKDKRSLSALAVAVLEREIGHANGLPDCVFSCSAVDIPHQGVYGDKVAMWKGEIIKKILLPHIATTIIVNARNSIDEAVNTKAALVEMGIAPRKIIIFCEFWHATRLWVVWKKTFGWRAQIELHPMPRIGRDYMQTLFRSRWLWPIITSAAAVVTLLLPLKWLSGFWEPD